MRNHLIKVPGQEGRLPAFFIRAGKLEGTDRLNSTFEPRVSQISKIRNILYSLDCQRPMAAIIDCVVSRRGPNVLRRFFASLSNKEFRHMAYRKLSIKGI